MTVGDPPFEAFVPHTTTMSRRRLQNILIVRPEDQPEAVSAPEEPESIIVDSKPTQVMVCDQFTSDLYASQSSLSLTYAIEMDEEESVLDPAILDAEVPKIASGEIVEIAGNTLCRGVEIVSGNETSKVMCVQSVSSGTALREDLVCEPTLEVSRSCALYSGQLQVVHTPECTHEDVRSYIEIALAECMEDPHFVDAVNEDLQTDGAAVTRGYLYDFETERTIVGVAAPVAAGGGGATAGGTTMIVLLVLLAAFVAAALMAWRRHVKRRQQMLDEDLKSCHTRWGAGGDDPSLLRPDFYDLNLKASNMDVHYCTSALCELCRTRNLGVVNMVRVPDSFDLSPDAYDEGVEAAPAKEPNLKFLQVQNPRRLTNWDNYDEQPTNQVVL